MRRDYRLFLEMTSRARRRARSGLPLAFCAFATIAGGCSQDPPETGRDGGSALLGALTSDAGLYATPRTPNQVWCIDRQCAPPDGVCCGIATFDSVDAGPAQGDGGITTGESAWNGGYVTSCAADAVTCQGDLNQACDGREDCPDAESCCITDLAGWYFKAKCLAMCGSSSEAPGLWFQLCHDHTECPNDFPACCWQRIADRPAAFGACYALATVAKMRGTVSCDVP